MDHDVTLYRGLRWEVPRSVRVRFGSDTWALVQFTHFGGLLVGLGWGIMGLKDAGRGGGGRGGGL